MKFERKTCIIAIVFGYGFLIGMFLLSSKKDPIRLPCSISEPCVRFCCKNGLSCKEDFIRATFEGNFTSDDFEQDEMRAKNFIILRGTPNCDLQSVGNNFDYIGWVRN